MSRASMIIILGILIMLVPFSGLPIAYRSFMVVVFGLCVLGLGVSLRAREVRKMQSNIEPPPSDVSETESVGFQEPSSL